MKILAILKASLKILFFDINITQFVETRALKAMILVQSSELLIIKIYILLFLEDIKEPYDFHYKVSISLYLTVFKNINSIIK